MHRFSDTSSLSAVLSTSFIMGVMALFGAAPIAKADEALGFGLTLASSSARSTLAEPLPIILTRNDELPHRAAPTVLADVQDQTALEAYAATLLRNDHQITRIELSPERVTMAYRSQERVAGFGVRQVERTITVTDDGSVYMNRPWYTQDGGSAGAPESGFTDLALVRTAAGFTPETEARILTRMQGRFAIGAL